MLSTNKLFRKNTYLFNHRATVTSISTDEIGTAVQLDETIFHPQGGGQPADIGTIDDVPVIKLTDKDGEIKHYIEAPSPLQVGQTVQLAIDEATRTEHAALHSTGHILHGVLVARYGLGRQTACNHFPKQASVTYETNGKSMPDPGALTEDVQAIIDASTPLSIIDVEGERHLEVSGYPSVRCGGTHINNAAELKGFGIRSIRHDKKGGTYKVSYTVGYGAFFSPAKEEHAVASEYSLSFGSQ